MPGILEGKKILVTGVLTPASIAFAIADLAQKEGADIVLTNFGRVMSLTEKSARRMNPTPDILEMDVNNQPQIDALAQTLKQRWGRLDGFVHAIAFAPGDALGGNFMTAPWESVPTAFLDSSASRARGASAHRSAGIARTERRSPRWPACCSPTTAPRPPARSSSSTAATTRWVRRSPPSRPTKACSAG